MTHMETLDVTICYEDLTHMTGKERFRISFTYLKACTGFRFQLVFQAIEATACAFIISVLASHEPVI